MLAVLSFGSARSAGAVSVALVPIATGLPRPIDIAHAGDGSGRLFFVLQNGQIVIHDGARVLPAPFLDIRPLVLCCGERGLLGVAFHPNYAVNGLFYLHYIDRSGNTVIARYQVSADPNVADPGSAAILLTENQPFSNHNGGQIHFGPDGYLYIALGDGGSGGDPQNLAQNLGSGLGKMLRIDVDGGTPFAIPPDNPFVGVSGARPEIWAYGLRNPFRFSFDRLTGDLFIGDVGQNRREEIDFQPAGSAGGENYGWRLMEGNLCFNPPSNCNNGTLVLPIIDYPHLADPCSGSVTGGYRYRGAAFPQLTGLYFYADFCTGRLWAATEQSNGSWVSEELLDNVNAVSTFGEDEDGELYLAQLDDTNGIVFRIVADSLEVGDATVDGNWQTISLPSSFVDPVVIAGPPSFNDTAPGVVRLRDVTASSFQARFQEWTYLDGVHGQETFSYLVADADRETLPNGTVVEIGRFSLGDTGVFQAQAFSQAFPGKPALFLTLQTFRGSETVTVRARNVTASGFEAALFEEQALMNGHGTEEVGYLAVYSASGSGTIEVGSRDEPFLVQAPVIDDRFAPVLSSTLKLEEEVSADAEVTHIKEGLSVLALGRQLFAQDVTSRGRDTVALRRLAPGFPAPVEWGSVSGVGDGWTKVPLFRQYSDPVVVARPVSTKGSAPGVIRLRNVTGAAFDLRYQEWAYLDGVHAGEQVFYMVAEAGTASLAGLALEAGRLTSSLLLGGGFEAVSFGAGFIDAPAVLSSVQTASGGDPVTTRLSGVSASGFLITMDEEEAKTDGHTTEALGWIALERGSGTTSDGRAVSVFNDSVGNLAKLVPFGQTFDRLFPVLAADVITTRGGDPVFLRYRGLTPSSVQLFLQEEQSFDAETTHLTEDISVFVAE